eukprot:NODE_39_length_29903_cov_0.529057.p22 type:complete len:101 gc:universal NODE_39_length_29903_cov_0.529057:5629-5931(+)
MNDSLYFSSIIELSISLTIPSDCDLTHCPLSSYNEYACVPSSTKSSFLDLPIVMYFNLCNGILDLMDANSQKTGFWSGRPFCNLLLNPFRCRNAGLVSKI